MVQQSPETAFTQFTGEFTKFAVKREQKERFLSFLPSVSNFDARLEQHRPVLQFHDPHLWSPVLFSFHNRTNLLVNILFFIAILPFIQ